MFELILGGARSGKSALAERKAQALALPTYYIATARALDEEMSRRIERHQADRPSGWITVEEPVDLARAIESTQSPEHVIIIDCLTLWLTNLLLMNQPEAMEQHIERLYHTVEQHTGHLIMVSNETGLGVVPVDLLSRQFVDQSGWLHQNLAELADRVTLTVAGLPLTLKDSLS